MTAKPQEAALNIKSQGLASNTEIRKEFTCAIEHSFKKREFALTRKIKSKE